MGMKNKFLLLLVAIVLGLTASILCMILIYLRSTLELQPGVSIADYGTFDGLGFFLAQIFIFILGFPLFTIAAYFILKNRFGEKSSENSNNEVNEHVEK